MCPFNIASGNWNCNNCTQNPQVAAYLRSGNLLTVSLQDIRELKTNSDLPNPPENSYDQFIDCFLDIFKLDNSEEEVNKIVINEFEDRLYKILVTKENVFFLKQFIDNMSTLEHLLETYKIICY